MIFVDTTIWFAAYVHEDPDHAVASELIAAPGARLVTTDFVIDELLTLLKARGHYQVAKAIGPLIFAGRVCKIVWLDRAEVESAWQVFNSFEDKQWSFTDCTSYAIMRQLGVQEALSLDEHFRQFGFATVRP